MKTIQTVIIGIAIVLSNIFVFAQKVKKDNYNDIIQSTDIQRIERFLAECHPEDPRKFFLKPKLIRLKNAEWTKGAKNAKPMEIRPIEVVKKKVNLLESNPDEAEEFAKLNNLTTNEHKQKTVITLNNMFDEDPNKKEAILLVKNLSSCNLIIRIRGEAEYNLPIPANGQNMLVLKKGTYNLNSSVCMVAYSSTIKINTNELLQIYTPVITTLQQPVLN